MAKFKIIRKFSLDFLGEDWKTQECFIDFEGLTIRDLKDNLSDLVGVNKDDTASVQKGIINTVEILEKRFVSGKAVGSKGEAVVLAKTDLVDLPAEVLTEALNFLSQGLTPKAKTP